MKLFAQKHFLINKKGQILESQKVQNEGTILLTRKPLVKILNLTSLILLNRSHCSILWMPTNASKKKEVQISEITFTSYVEASRFILLIGLGNNPIWNQGKIDATNCG